jgi:transforming growth factor-beta-induced protein
MTHIHTRHLGRVTIGLTLLLAACSSDAIDDNATDDGSSDTVTLDSAVDEAADRVDSAREALADGDLSTMLEALNLSSVGDEIEGRAVTILAPTNDAFAALPAGELTDLLGDPSQIDDVLRRHIIDGAMSFDELATRDEVTTISGESLAVSSTGDDVTVEGATVTAPDNDAMAGQEGEEVVVLRVDHVLLPGS